MDTQARAVAATAPRTDADAAAAGLKQALERLYLALPGHGDGAGQASGSPHQELHATITALEAQVAACRGAITEQDHLRLAYASGVAILTTVVGAFYHRLDPTLFRSTKVSEVAAYLQSLPVPLFCETDRLVFLSKAAFRFTLESASADLAVHWWRDIVSAIQDLQQRGPDEVAELEAFEPLRARLDAPAVPMITEASQSRAPSLALARLSSVHPN
jgi:hypothetical protein